MKFQEVDAKSIDLILRAFDRAHLPPCEGREILNFSTAVARCQLLSKKIKEELSREKELKAAMEKAREEKAEKQDEFMSEEEKKLAAEIEAEAKKAKPVRKKKVAAKR